MRKRSLWAKHEEKDSSGILRSLFRAGGRQKIVSQLCSWLTRWRGGYMKFANRRQQSSTSGITCEASSQPHGGTEHYRTRATELQAQVEDERKRCQ